MADYYDELTDTDLSMVGSEGVAYSCSPEC